MDPGLFIGIGVALFMILLGNSLEGGHLGSIVQGTAAMIVIGGTIGAVLVQFPLGVCAAAVKSIGKLVKKPGGNAAKLVDEIVDYANRARREGILGLEKLAPGASDPFLSKALMMAVDGADSNTIRDTLEILIAEEEEHGENAAKVYEAAGGYSPTIGIIGAVMGLIQVMKNLSDIDKVGHGIAVSFVATVYGVALANIFLLPAANKMKARVLQDSHMREMMLEGVTGIVEGLNPKLIRSKLEAYAPPKPEKVKKGALPVPETEAGD